MTFYRYSMTPRSSAWRVIGWVCLLAVCGGCVGNFGMGPTPKRHLEPVPDSASTKSLAAPPVPIPLTVSLQYPFASPGWRDTGMALAVNAAGPCGFFKATGTETNVSILRASTLGGQRDSVYCQPFANADRQPFRLAIEVAR